ncbi:acyltransferase family protein [Nitrincola alkalilacustris]|uniref:acyltransferase family protein n=1 Tax=Nitrincola alkalilacustris TaxID=1571224 RepID=UPI00124C2C86|nr:acyltransferase [Nitrincola alkalilacustris]
MKSQNIAHNPRLDHLRCLAAAIVFLFHTYHYYFLKWQPVESKPWFGIISEGHTGVGLFFTLSGFLFMLIALNNDQISYRNFITNRFLRIFPLFLVIFFIAISVSRDQFRAADWGYMFFSNLGEAPTSGSFITGAAWTISIEFTFYLVFPFLGRFAKERGTGYLIRLILLMLLFKMAAYGVAGNPMHMYYSTLLGRFDQFLIGMLFALLYTQHHEWLSRRGWLWVIGAGLLVLLNSGIQARYASYFMAEPWHAFWVTWSMQEALGWGLFILFWASAAINLPRWLDRLLQKGGEISYSFYLLHGLIIFLSFQLVGPIHLTGKILLDGLIVSVLLYLITWWVACLSYDTIEKPFLALRRRYG